MAGCTNLCQRLPITQGKGDMELTPPQQTHNPPNRPATPPYMRHRQRPLGPVQSRHVTLRLSYLLLNSSLLRDGWTVVHTPKVTQRNLPSDRRG